MAFLIDTSTMCLCGHEVSVHDRHGCAAFLGAYPKTALRKHYCRCPIARRGTELTAAPLVDAVVATVRIRERRGAAIAVCEFPPALELGASRDDVESRVLRRLADVVSPSARGDAQLVHVIHEDVDEERFARLRRSGRAP